MKKNVSQSEQSDKINIKSYYKICKTMQKVFVLAGLVSRFDGVERANGRKAKTQTLGESEVG